MLKSKAFMYRLIFSGALALCTLAAILFVDTPGQKAAPLMICSGATILIAYFPLNYSIDRQIVLACLSVILCLAMWSYHQSREPSIVQESFAGFTFSEILLLSAACVLIAALLVLIWQSYRRLKTQSL